MVDDEGEIVLTIKQRDVSKVHLQNSIIIHEQSSKDCILICEKNVMSELDLYTLASSIGFLLTIRSARAHHILKIVQGE